MRFYAPAIHQAEMLNKTIWLLWLQGWDQAPWLVRQVARSWEINNPGWNIEYVDLDNLRSYVDDVDCLYDDRKDISPQTKSDIIRLSLLRNHGGVWADATLLCMQPLDFWVQEAVRPAGLWMYHGNGAGMGAKHGPAIWFIASEAGSLMIERWKRASDAYWAENDRTQGYFWLDGLFRDLFKNDASFRKQWRRAPHLFCSAQGQAHMLARNDRMTSSDSETKRLLEERPPYALKLSWKRWQDAFPDPESDECRNSNGCFAIRMAQRGGIAFRHPMRDKSSLAFQFDMSAREVRRKMRGARRRLGRWTGAG